MAEEAVAQDPKPRGQRRKAAGAAIGAAKGTGEAAPLVAPAAYAKKRHEQKKQQRQSRTTGTGAPTGGGGAGGGTRAPGGGKGGGGRAPRLPARAPATRTRRFAGWAWSGSRRLLAAEFVLCMAVLLAGYLIGRVNAKDARSQAAGTFVSIPSPREGSIHVMVKGSALAALFFLLALVSSAGKGPAKVATGLGTLVTATYVFTSADVHKIAAWTSSFFATGKESSALGGETTTPINTATYTAPAPSTAPTSSDFSS